MAVHTTQKPGAREIASIVRGLTRENRPESPVVTVLRRQVANGFVLYANFKQYHWQTHGPHFRDLHKLFDKFGGEILASVDELAERIRMIGQDPPGSLTEMVEFSTVSAATHPATMREMIQEARQNAVIVIEEFRHAARVAQEHDDPGTVDVCSRLVQVHEKQEWWLRDILREGDGL